MSQLIKFAASIECKTLRTKFLREVGKQNKGIEYDDTFDWEYLNEILNSLQN